MLTQDQINTFHEQGFIRIPQLFSPEEMDEMATDLDWMMETWAATWAGWSGPWRKVLMDQATEKKSKLTALHDLHLYAGAWCRALTSHRIAEAMADLLGGDVELHHSTLHAKPPGAGQPFPMHQDSAFYQHTDGRYVDVLVHLDDTCHANGEIRFLAGSHTQGHLDHITETPEGKCTPHLPTDVYKLEDTVPVPAKRGDIVCFNIHTIHGSYINTTDKVRRMVRVGYRDPANIQLAGQALGRPGFIVHGRRPRTGANEELVMDETTTV